MHKSVLVTGYSGFVGNAMAMALASRGYSVTGLLRTMDADPRRRSANAITVKALQDLQRDQTARFDAIVHAAGLAHVSDNSADETVAALQVSNVGLTSDLCDLAVRWKAGSFVNISTVAATGGRSSPTVLNDFAVPAPQSAYGRTKLEAEGKVHQLAGCGIMAISLRPPLIAGSNAKANWRKLMRLADTAIPLPFDGLKSRRSLITIDSLCARVAAILEAHASPALSGTYHVADAPPLQLGEIIQALRRGMERKSRLFMVPDAMFKAMAFMPQLRAQVESLTGPLIIDSGRFEETFGFKATTNLIDEIARIGTEYRKTKSLV